MRAAGEFIAALTIFAARVQRGEHHFHARNFINRVNVHWNAAPVVANADRAIDVDINFDARAKSCEMFVD